MTEQLGSAIIAYHALPEGAKVGNAVMVYEPVYVIESSPQEVAAIGIPGYIVAIQRSEEPGNKSRCTIRFENGNDLTLCAEMLLRRRVRYLGPRVMPPSPIAIAPKKRKQRAGNVKTQETQQGQRASLPHSF